MTKPVAGFGSPSMQFANGYFSQGFGSPSAGVDFAFDPAWGFGDPSAGWLDPMMLLPLGGQHWYPDDGGCIVTVTKANWKALSGTFRITVRNIGSGTVYSFTGPGTSGLRDHTVGKGLDVSPSLDGKRLSFCLPVLPLGAYDILVNFGPPDFGQQLVFASAFEVVFRHHAREQWSIRANMPPQWKGAGPRSLLTEPALVDPANSKEFPQLNLQAVTRSLAEAVQIMAGQAVTRLTQDMLETDGTAHVETGLGFPPNGGMFSTGGRLFKYTGTTETTLTGCVRLHPYNGAAVFAGSAVTAVVNSWVPKD